MKGYLKIMALLAFALCVPLQAEAQTVWQKCVSAMSSHCAEFDFSYAGKSGSGSPEKWNGSVKVQGHAFVLKSSGVEIWCDGVACRTVDAGAKEVIIEPVQKDLQPDFFREVSSVMVNVGGNSLEKVSLKPQAPVSGIASVTVYVDTASSLPVFRKATVRTNEGNDAEVVISGMKYTAPVPVSSFVFRTDSLDSSWVVTDLR